MPGDCTPRSTLRAIANAHDEAIDETAMRTPGQPGETSSSDDEGEGEEEG